MHSQCVVNRLVPLLWVCYVHATVARTVADPGGRGFYSSPLGVSFLLVSIKIRWTCIFGGTDSPPPFQEFLDPPVEESERWCCSPPETLMRKKILQENSDQTIS